MYGAGLPAESSLLFRTVFALLMLVWLPPAQESRDVCLGHGQRQINLFVNVEVPGVAPPGGGRPQCGGPTGGNGCGGRGGGFWNISLRAWTALRQVGESTIRLALSQVDGTAEAADG